MSEFSMWNLVVPSVALIAVVNAAGYCSSNNFASNTSWLQFTKEPVPTEYAFESSFKSIHCCGKGYRSIEWFKDDLPYPWPANVSTLILYPEAANQTLYTQGSTRQDAGNYTCRMSNETHTQYHTVHVNIMDKAPESPKVMFISEDTWAEEGKQVRLFCEALVGPSYLADSKNELRWRKVWANNTEGELLPTQMEIRTTREDNPDILGSYLDIPRVSSVDYGAYVCAIHCNEIISKRYVTLHYKATVKNFESNMFEYPWRNIVMFAVFGAAILVSLIVLHRKFTPRLLLSVRLMHARATPVTHRNRVLEKEFDVAVSFAAVDEALVRGALVHTLAVKYNYRVLPLCLSAPENWYAELSVVTSRARALVCVMSPRQYPAPALLEALRQLRAIPHSPVLVLLQDLPKLKLACKSRGECPGSVLRGLRPLAWRHLHDRAFWTALRLALPLPPPQVNEEPRKSCSGSLDALV